MALSSSAVISDYESSRRKSPGAKFIRKFVLALLQIDEEKGSRFIREEIQSIHGSDHCLSTLR